MPDYKTMYRILCSAASKALDALPEAPDALPEAPDNAAGRDILQKALYEAEEMYVGATDKETEAVG